MARQAAWLKALRAEDTLLLDVVLSALGFTRSSSAGLHIAAPSRELTEFEKLLG